MWDKFKNSKLGSTALAIGATSLASLVAAGPAKATDCTPIQDPGGSSLSSPTVIDPTCTFTEISIATSQDTPAYWEFSWDQIPFDPVNISASGSFSGDFPTLSLYNASDDSLVTSSEFGSFSGTPPFGETSLGDLVLAPEDYIIGIDSPPSGSETLFAMNITFAPATDTPEPATFGLFGSALAGLGFIRKRHKPSA